MHRAPGSCYEVTKMPNKGRPPHARMRIRETPDSDDWRWSWHESERDPDATASTESDPRALAPPTRVCPRCSAQTATDSRVCPRCLASYCRQRPRAMSRRAKIARRLVPALVLLIGGIAAGTALAINPDTAARPAPVTIVPAKTETKTAPQQVEIHSATQTETQQVETQVAAVAQMVAAVPVIQEQSSLAPVTTTPADESSSSSNASSGGVPVSDEAPVDGGGPNDGPTSEQSTYDSDGDGCSDSYKDACVPPYSGVDDVKCDDIPEADFRSVRDDPYRLDREGDGIACES
jgi:hypothetical protein